MLIDGFGLSNYRSFRLDTQLLGPLSKVNILAGANNSGKSNVLLFLKQHFADVLKAARAGASYANLRELDRPVGTLSGSSQIAFGRVVQGEDYVAWRESLGSRLKHNSQLPGLVDKVYSFLSSGGPIAWFYYEGAWGERLRIARDFVDRVVPALGRLEWETLCNAFPPVMGSDLINNLIPGVLRALSPIHNAIPKVSLIPAIRRIDVAQGSEEDYSGIGLIDRLARLQNPSLTQQYDKERFEKVNRFVRTVMGSENARLEIPYERDLILVHMDGKTLPLSSLGTGVHEVVILAAAATVLTEQILCIEEPEIHLHPTLQRKLLTYLSEKTDNQYFIATHSAQLLDTPGAQIFHVRHEGGGTLVRSVGSPRAKVEICADLGYRPSDLLQANSIIWVEGPSDRIYLNHWLRSVAPELLEGVHYSIMFYGGRLLSHLSANDPEVNEFISLRRLNRHISILIDSDKRNARTPVNETKKRVMEEFDEGPGFAWLTSGREIESYIPSGILEQAMRVVCPKF